MKILSIFIGNEILKGRTLNTNEHFLCGFLSEKGYEITQTLTIPDNKEVIIRETRKGLKEFDIVIIGGGLGPTSDDITREAISAAIQRPLVFNESLYQEIQEKYKNYRFNLPDVNRKQAMLPEGSTAIPNHVGMAYGIEWNQDNRKLFVLPGVPAEFIGMSRDYVLPKLECFGKANKFIPVLFRTSQIPESVLMTQVAPIAGSHGIPTDKLGFYPSYGGVDLIYHAETPNKEFIEAIKMKFHENIYSMEKKDLRQLILEQCRKQNKTLAVAESCTGGLAGEKITDIPGSSDVFLGGIIAYNNSIKANLLKVDPSILEKYGAVSKETAEQMLTGLLNETKADYGVAITGIAGPEGGSEEKPVGTVHIAYGSMENRESRLIHGGKTRKIIRERSVNTAFYYLWKLICD